MSKTIGFIGLGTMGSPMAENILTAGHDLRVFDLDRDAMNRLKEKGAIATESPAEASRNADVVITMLPSGSNVEAALFGQNGAAEAMDEHVLYIDMSTILPADSDRIQQQLHARGIAMVDAPVGRSSRHAEQGKLLIMVGGEEAHVERARPLLDKLGDTIVHCGPSGAGERMKIVNNYMSIALNVLTAESLTMAEQCGLDPEQARQVMLGTVAGQGHMGTTYPAKVLEDDLTPGFMVNLAHKDLGLALEMATQLNTPSLMGSVARAAYENARAQGHGRQDWTAVYACMRDAANSTHTAQGGG